MSKIEPTVRQLEKFTLFMRTTNVPDLNHTLRAIVIEYMGSKKSYDFDRQDFAHNVIGLFEFLDELEVMQE